MDWIPVAASVGEEDVVLVVVGVHFVGVLEQEGAPGEGQLELVVVEMVDIEVVEEGIHVGVVVEAGAVGVEAAAWDTVNILALAAAFAESVDDFEVACGFVEPCELEGGHLVVEACELGDDPVVVAAAYVAAVTAAFAVAVLA